MNRKKGFNEFLDRHRDPKDIEREVLEVSSSTLYYSIVYSIVKVLYTLYYSLVDDDCNHAGQVKVLYTLYYSIV